MMVAASMFMRRVARDGQRSLDFILGSLSRFASEVSKHLRPPIHLVCPQAGSERQLSEGRLGLLNDDRETIVPAKLDPDVQRTGMMEITNHHRHNGGLKRRE